MIHRPTSVLFAVAVLVLFGTGAKSEAPREVKTEKNKAVVIGNFFNAPTNCSTNPGPVPLPILRGKPLNGRVGLQIVMADVAATDACPARKIPAIALFYTPNKDFVGSDTVQVEVEAGDARITDYSLMIMVLEEAGGK